MKYSFGNILRATAFADEKYCDRSACFACDNSGMSGSDGAGQTHNNETDAMWLTIKDPGENNTICFDLGDIKQIGYMYIWNFNQPGFTGAGLRDVRILCSCNYKDWSELKGRGYPYRFAKAGGLSAQPATNLDDGSNTPVSFDGISARYVKIVPDTRKNIGNWGDYIEGQHRYGLSEVRFYAYKPEIKAHGYIPADAFHMDKRLPLCNLTNSYGMSDNGGKNALHGNEPETMWLSELIPYNRSLLFDLDGTYPVEEMLVWNYNCPDNTGAGIKNVKIYYSVDGACWTELKGEGYPYQFACAGGLGKQPATNLNDGKNTPVKFGGAMARFIRLELAGGPGVGTWGGYNGYENRFGLSKIRFYATEGYCIEPERNLSSLFSSYNGWSGADGIFTAPVDGVELKKAGDEQKNVKSIAIFGDTLISTCNPVTRARKLYNIVNNSSAVITGTGDYITFDFRYKYNEDGIPENLVKPAENEGYYYWFQDCAVIQNKLYSFTDNIVQNLSKSEGFQFDLVGVDCVSFDINNEAVDFNSARAVKTPLFLKKYNLYFGCAILPNTFEAKLPFADGYIYIYGLAEFKALHQSLVVARVKPEDFEDFNRFEFYNGQGFCGDINKVSAICEDGASEMSITPIEGGEHNGKYLFVCVDGGVGDTVVCRIGETPWGPFGEKMPVYAIDDPLTIEIYGGRKIYTYNAKAHYHLSNPGELLISFNINSTDFESHIKNCDIYRPRFIKIRRL